MPCYDPDDHHHISEIVEVDKKLDSITDKLCRTCNIIESNKLLHLLPNDILDWYAQHKIKDKERKLKCQPN